MNYAFGLARIRSGNKAWAVRRFAPASAFEPGDSQHAYAITLHGTGQVARAKQVLAVS